MMWRTGSMTCLKNLTCGLPLVVGCLAVLAGTGNAEAAEAAAPFAPSVSEQVLVDFPYDSDFVPDGSPLQIRLQAGIRDSFSLHMPGDGIYDFEAQSLTLVGEPGAGEIGYGVVATTEISIKLEIMGFPIEVDIIEQLLGGQPLEIAIPVAGTFDPYLLAGSDAPVEIAQDIPLNVLNQEFSLAGLMGTIKLDVVFELYGASYRTTLIDILQSEDGPVEVTLTD
ncbi:MAG: hypothetical protein ACPG77_13145, partial [Nannocystaceae bacterium]